jgi:hypothetical protein
LKMSFPLRSRAISKPDLCQPHSGTTVFAFCCISGYAFELR